MSDKIDISTQFSYTDYDGLQSTRMIENVSYGTFENIQEGEFYFSETGKGAKKRNSPHFIEVEKEKYIIDEKLTEVVNLSIALGRPLLLQGEPGCGKTCLAYAVAYALGLPLEVCYVKSTTTARELLYRFDAVKRLYDAQIDMADHPVSEEGKKELRFKNIRHYITPGPLGRAIARGQSKRRSVVLIDEIDKADIDFPNDLLWELDRLEFFVEEDPALQFKVDKETPQMRPIIFITHNEEKALPTAFLRRCIFYYVQFPESQDHLKDILTIHGIGNEKLSTRAIEIFSQIRELDLKKNPGISELIDWVGYMNAVKTPVKSINDIPFIGALLKHETDRKRVKSD